VTTFYTYPEPTPKWADLINDVKSGRFDIGMGPVRTAEGSDRRQRGIRSSATPTSVRLGPRGGWWPAPWTTGVKMHSQTEPILAETDQRAVAQ
jgi:hypothetical protein